MKCTTYYFRPLGLLLLLCLIPLCSIAQNITVKGIVKDNLGESVIGANVTEKGTTNGMITDLDGNFSLTVQKNATLVISYIGYVTQEIAIKGNTNLNIILKEDSKALEEVVVIGYGTARKSDVTGSIASVGGDKLQEMPSTNITYALQNRVAGVDMTQTSSQPGATMQIRIYNPQIQISAESETKRSIFREKDKTKRSKKESAQHSKSRNKSFVMTSVSAL